MSQPTGGAGASGATEEDVIALTRRVGTLEAEVAALQHTVANLCTQLGVSANGV